MTVHRNLTILLLSLLLATQAEAEMITLGPSSDYYIDPNGTISTGDDTVFNTVELRAGKFTFGNAGAESHLRAFLSFDLSSIPSGSVINSADLRLFHLEGGNDSFGGATVHAITGSGVDASFGTHDDIFGANTGNLVTPPHEGDSVYHQIDVTPEIQNWLDGLLANHGFMIRGTEGFGGTGKLFNSFDATSNQPQLVIDFTAPIVPEPASIAIWSIFGLGLAGFRHYRRRRSK